MKAPVATVPIRSLPALHSASSAPVASVLVVDPAQETSEVLETIFQRRGVRVLSARRADDGLRLAEQHHPQVIVWDLDAKARDPVAVAEGFEQAAREHDASLLLLGNRSRLTDGFSRPRLGEYVTKPFQFGPLVRQIEELLARRARLLARAA